MIRLIDGIAGKIGGGDVDKGFRIVLVVGLLAIIIGCVTGMVMYLSGGGKSSDAPPTEVHLWCSEQQKEVILSFEAVRKAEDAWVGGGNPERRHGHLQHQQLSQPGCRRFHGVELRGTCV